MAQTQDSSMPQQMTGLEEEGHHGTFVLPDRTFA